VRFAPSIPTSPRLDDHLRLGSAAEPFEAQALVADGAGQVLAVSAERNRFSDFKGYEDWAVVSSARTDEMLKVIVANPTMIEAYKAGVPGNGRLFPDGSKIVKLQWRRNNVALSRREHYLLIVAGPADPASLPVTLLDGERFLYRRPREHTIVMRLERWIGARRPLDAGPETPVHAEEMYIGNRVAVDSPLAVTELSVGDRKGIGDVFRSSGARAMHCRCRERHPGDHLGLVLQIAFWPQTRGRILASDVVERGRHLGPHAPALGDKHRHLPIRI
jgi:hypothetical protein